MFMKSAEIEVIVFRRSTRKTSSSFRSSQNCFYRTQGHFWTLVLLLPLLDILQLRSGRTDITFAVTLRLFLSVMIRRQIEPLPAITRSLRLQHTHRRRQRRQRPSRHLRLGPWLAPAEFTHQLRLAMLLATLERVCLSRLRPPLLSHRLLRWTRET